MPFASIALHPFVCYATRGKGDSPDSMNKLMTISGLSTLLIVILSACGASGGASTTLNLTMTDFAFVPNSLTVPAGKEITLNLTNSGAVAHDFMIMNLGQELNVQDHLDPEAHANAFWEQELLEAGQTVKSTFTAPSEPGEYQIVCGVAGHLQAGMQGRLIVVEAP